MESHDKPQICDLPAGKFGFCCQTGQNHTAPRLEQISSKERRSGIPTILPLSVLDEARRNFEHLMHGIAQIPVRRGFPDFAHGLVFHSTAKDDLHNFAISNSAIEQVMTTQLFGKKEQVPVEDFITNNVPVKFTETPLAQHCQPPPLCRNIRSVYRSLDGTCNNPLPQRSLWGAAGQPMERLLPPAYEDGIWTPRARSADGTPLLGPRKISRTLLSDVDRPHPIYNLLVMQFGQVVVGNRMGRTLIKILKCK